MNKTISHGSKLLSENKEGFWNRFFEIYTNTDLKLVYTSSIIDDKEDDVFYLNKEPVKPDYISKNIININNVYLHMIQDTGSSDACYNTYNIINQMELNDHITTNEFVNITNVQIL